MGKTMELSFGQKEELGYKYVWDLLEPVCPYGVKRLNSEGFYGPDQREELEKEQDNVGFLLEALQSDGFRLLALRESLQGLKDLSGSFLRCESETLSEVELFELTALCRRLEALRQKAEALPVSQKLTDIRFVPLDGALKVLDPSGGARPSFYVEDARSEALRAAREAKRSAELALRTTASGPEREHLLAGRQEAAKAEEEALCAIYKEMSEALRPHLPALRENTAAAGRLDACLAKAMLARRFGCVRPGIGGEELILRDAVHPLVAAALEERKRAFTPISLSMPKGVTVLTGANMGGKSVAVKTVVLNLALALSGFFVFAKAAKVPLFDRLELINKDLSDAARGLSSFGGEILRFNEAAEHLKEGGLSFIAMDEFARGTNAREGAAIARGTVKYLSDKNAVTLLATHYDGAAQFAAKHYQVKGLKKLSSAEISSPASENHGENQGYGSFPAHGLDALRRIENAMDYGLIPVETEAACPQDALTISRLLGLPEEILAEAENM
ncbi:MAG: hypothetical protein J5496_08075 [Lachnospiraceae bacterium]|nr:hypothetical protein [Lachnospiraceae bacterium]